MAFGSIHDSRDCTEKFLASRHSVNLSCARIPATPDKISTIRTAAATKSPRLMPRPHHRIPATIVPANKTFHRRDLSFAAPNSFGNAANRFGS